MNFKSIRPINLQKCGIDASLITNNYKDQINDFECIICIQLAFDPVICNNCEVVMCNNCIQSWLLKNNCCPSKCQDAKPVKLPRVLNNIINRIELKCPYSIPENVLSNSNEICNNIVKYENYLDHIDNCVFSQVKCLNCSEILLKKDAEKHNLKCNQLFIKCLICREYIDKNKMDKHIEVNHSQKYLNCNICENIFLEENFNEHKKYCKFSPLTTKCTLCKTIVQHHDINECINKHIKEIKSKGDNNFLIKENKDLKLKLDCCLKEIDSLKDMLNKAKKSNNGNIIFLYNFVKLYYR